MDQVDAELVDLPELTVVGLQVEAPFDELQRVVPATWRALSERTSELPPPPEGYVEVSEHLGAGRYRETLGVLGAAATAVPEGMATAVLPAGRWARLRHDGPLEEIPAGFGRLHDWCAARALAHGDFKLDRGYTGDGAAGPHDLFVDVLRPG